MRDAVGGTFMINVLLVFLAVYIVFIAVALNYAKAFRVKNRIIDIIEQNEGIEDYTDVGDNSVLGQVNDYLRSVSYYVRLSENKDDKYGICFDEGYCIEEPATVNNYGADETYYKVTTFVKLDFPFFNLSFTIPITGETRRITNLKG